MKVDFSNTEVAFRHKSNGELRFANYLFKFLEYKSAGNFFAKLSQVLLSIRFPFVKWIIKKTIFKQFVGGEIESEFIPVIEHLGKYNVHTILDYSVEGTESEESYQQVQDKVIELLELSKDNILIPVACIKISGLISNQLLEKINFGHTLSTSEQQALKNLHHRLTSIFETAQKLNKPVYVDAEESWIQGAIDQICEQYMLKYNSSKAIVFTTIQLYRKDRLDYLKALHEKFKKEHKVLGVKLVRGAYIEKEALYAQQNNTQHVLCDSKTHTDKQYNQAVEYCIKHLKDFEICLGTHNQKSIELAAKEMHLHKIEKSNTKIWFSQLYGMGDHLSFNLAKHQYNVSKYLPIGPVEQTIPYLKRRADENSAITGQMSQERTLIQKELNRRTRD